ncbi:Uncharacterized protein FWK35_00036858, partial [Aphis craccivora]
DIFLQLNSIKTQTDFMFNGKQFIHIPEDESFVCITSADNLQFMTTKCSDLFADGTFNYAPKYFTQLYTIHGFKNGYYLPLVYFFLFEKSKEMYKKIWLFLKELCMKCNETEFILQKLHVDFEKAAHQAASEVFEDVQLISCRFHLGQSWWRKINSDSVLRLAYKKKDDALGNWLKMFFGLAFLPSHEVSDAFVELISVCPDEIACTEFSDYIFNNYIDDGSQFPPNIWAEEPTFNPRTTNAAESFHRTYNSQFYKAHPHIHLVIIVLQETQAETITKMQSIASNNNKKISVIENQKINFTIKAYQEYYKSKNADNLLKYLLKVGNKYLGKEI